MKRDIPCTAKADALCTKCLKMFIVNYAFWPSPLAWLSLAS